MQFAFLCTRWLEPCKSHTHVGDAAGGGAVVGNQLGARRFRCERGWLQSILLRRRLGLVRRKITRNGLLIRAMSKSSPHQTRPRSRRRPQLARSPPREDFPVVGIGASAGGLDACRELVEALPADTG